MNQAQGPSRESSGKQQEQGPETGLETRLQHDSSSIQHTMLEIGIPTK